MAEPLPGLEAAGRLVAEALAPRMQRARPIRSGADRQQSPIFANRRLCSGGAAL